MQGKSKETEKSDTDTTIVAQYEIAVNDDWNIYTNGHSHDIHWNLHFAEIFVLIETQYSMSARQYFSLFRNYRF